MKFVQKYKKGLLPKILMIVGIYVLLFVLVENRILNRHYSSLIVPICINIILAVSLTLTTGFLGELNLGHAGFMSIGAYSGALLSMSMPSVPPLLAILLAMIAGGLVAALFGIIIGVPVLRLKGDYLAIVTLAFGEIIRSVINNLEFLGAASGLKPVPLYTNYTIAYVVAIVVILLITNLVNSRYGRNMKAIRENAIAAEAIGIHVSYYKTLTFVIAAFFAGVAGVLYGHNLGILKSSNFDYNRSIEILVMVVLGGMGSVKGSIIAAIVLTLLPEVLRGADTLRMLLYALALILIMLFREGPLKEKIRALFRKRKEAKA